jgi:hypothetical protein
MKNADTEMPRSQYLAKKNPLMNPKRVTLEGLEGRV